MPPSLLLDAFVGIDTVTEGAWSGILRVMLRLLLAALLLAIPVLGQVPAPSLSPFEAARISVRAYGEDAGIPSNRVHAVHLDRKGLLWVGTQEGLAYFGGQGWTPLNLPAGAPSVYVRALAETSDGAFWIGTQDGGLWRLRNGLWRHFAGEKELPSHRVNTLLVTRENGREVLWIGTGGGGLLRLEGEQITRVDAVPLPWIWALAEVDLGQGRRELWAGGEKGISVLRDGWWRVLDQGWWKGGANALVQRRNAEGRAEVWASAWGQGVACYDPVEERFLPTPSLPSRNPTCLTVVRGEPDQVWVGTYDQGLFSYGDNRWEACALPRRLASSGIYALQPNPGGRPLLWAGTRGAGLLAIDPEGWRALGVEEGLPSAQANCFLETREESEILWIGTDKGIARWGASGLRVEGRAHGLPSDFITDLAALQTAKGTEIWAGTLLGLARREGGRWIPEKGFPFQRIITLQASKDAEGEPELLVGADGGLGRLSKGRWTLYTPADGLPGKMVYAVLPEVDAHGVRSLWVGIRGGGLARLREGSWQAFGPREGLPGLSVYGLAQTQGMDGRRWLWIALMGGGGLARLDMDHPEKGIQAWNSDPLPGLPSNSLQRLEAQANTLFLGTPRGVARVDLGGPDGSPLRVVAYTSRDGLPASAANSAASYLDHEGRLWVGTSAGVAVLDAKRTRAGLAPPRPLLEQIRVLGRVAPFAERLELGHHDKQVTVQVSVPIYHRREDVRLQWQLLGLETEPTPWTERTSRDFTTLPPRNYILRVWARDGFGQISPPLDIPLQVKPAPWATWWARTLMVLTGGALVLLVLRVRTRLLAERARRLEELVDIRTAELGEANEALRRQSLTDPLTGLGNRRFLELMILENLAQYHRHRLVGAEGRSHVFTLLLVDLDHFKQVNDTHGHQVGDAVLRQAAEVLRSTMREVDRVVRWGGEEFLVLASDVDLQEGPALAERIRAAIAGYLFDVGLPKPLAMRASVGFASFPLHADQPDALNWEQILSLADQCLYLAKSRGRDGWAGLVPVPGALPPQGPVPPDATALVEAGLLQRIQRP